MAAEKPASDKQSDDSQASHGKLGVAVRPLTGEEKQGASISGGVLVEHASGPAERSGMQAGDIIFSINGRAVSTVDDLKKVGAGNEKSLALLIHRGDAKLFVPVTLG